MTKDRNKNNILRNHTSQQKLLYYDTKKKTLVRECVYLGYSDELGYNLSSDLWTFLI